MSNFLNVMPVVTAEQHTGRRGCGDPPGLSVETAGLEALRPGCCIRRRQQPSNQIGGEASTELERSHLHSLASNLKDSRYKGIGNSASEPVVSFDSAGRDDAAARVAAVDAVGRLHELGGGDNKTKVGRLHEREGAGSFCKLRRASFVPGEGAAIDSRWDTNPVIRGKRRTEPDPCSDTIPAIQPSNQGQRSTPAARIRSWGESKNLTERQIQDLVSLLCPKHLRSLPVRKKSRVWPKEPQAANFRHHFYRQAANILGWVDQHKFEEEFIEIVRSVWPDYKNATTEVTKEGEGGTKLL